MANFLTGASGYLSPNPYYSALAQAYGNMRGLNPAVNSQGVGGVGMASNILQARAAMQARNLLAAQAQIQAQVQAQAAQAQAQAQLQAQAHAANFASYGNFQNPQNILNENVMNEFKAKAAPIHAPTNYADEYKQKSGDEPSKVQGNTIHFHF